jgi:pyridoxal phosphate enzyme (YggS family)
MRLQVILFFGIDFAALFRYICTLLDRMIAQNLEEVRKKISDAAFRSGRMPQDITLIAVSKTFGTTAILQAAEAGQRDFGENYVQELEQKRRELTARELRWHFIGHLQSNKVKQIVPHVALIHSVDSIHLAREIEKQADRLKRQVEILIELHTTDEATKFGVHPGKAVELIKALAGFKGVRISGLMTMGPFSDNPDDSRHCFQQLVELEKKIKQEGIENVSLIHRSMGMTHDFEVAIEEGATMVRIGTAIFGKRSKSTIEHPEGAS